MFRCPDVGYTSVPSMSTTCLPSTSPSVSNVGPGPSDTNGTVTATVRTLNATMGTSATSNVRIRLFTPPNVKVAAEVASVTTSAGEICVRAVKSTDARP